jgi:hypothetical protein
MIAAWVDPTKPKDMPPPKETIERVAQAVKIFLVEESDLLEVGINERSLTHSLAIHLGPKFKEWHTDCEYNRLGDRVKSLPKTTGSGGADDTEAFTIFPDIIVHRRRTVHNLVVIEVKKRGNNAHELDEAKLRGLTMAGDFEYTVGLHLIIDCKVNQISDATVYRDGKPDDELTEFTRALLIP